MKIKTLYVVHHSHTDIGYTDLQERILDGQVSYIKTAVNLLNKPEYQDFRWNCETYFCVEQFLNKASDAEKEQFFDLVRENRMGISAVYLNFNDLIDYPVLNQRVREMVEIFKQKDIPVKTAMIADINGMSMGQRDTLLDNGIEFLFTNVHTHHGMYPLYQNQNAFLWENKEGKRLLVWNGEHYNLGNALGLKPNRQSNFFAENYIGSTEQKEAAVSLKDNLDGYLTECEENGYPYDFIVSSVSGVFSDNAPPNTEIIDTIKEYERLYPDGVQIQMVSLQELYANIKDKVLEDAQVHKGDFNDWWGNGAGSTPYTVKHYKEAQRLYHLCGKLEEGIYEREAKEARIAQDNLLLYAEHTWGHSSTITNPYDTMVLNLDIRKNSYASKAHESASKMLNSAAIKLGDPLRYYNTCGKVKAIHTGSSDGEYPVEFYIESMNLKNVKITDMKSGEEKQAQISAHPRGVLISFVDTFKAQEQKEYRYEELPPVSIKQNTRVAYIGSERVRDIVNDYDKIGYQLPYGLESEYFSIRYEIGKGVTSFYNKKTGQEMLAEAPARFFTPIYEHTPIRTDSYKERSLLGRNIRGVHAALYEGILTDVKCIEEGPVFTTAELVYELEGTKYCSVTIKIYHKLPKVDFSLKIAKHLSDDVESVYMPLTLNLSERELYIKKGTEPFCPGIDQIPGTCMEYYMTDAGVIYRQNKQNIVIGTMDVPLIYMGEMKHHPILLCDNKKENNDRDVYSWVMNNTWETNFKMDLSGFSEFNYTLFMNDADTTENSFEKLDDEINGIYTLILE